MIRHRFRYKNTLYIQNFLKGIADPEFDFLKSFFEGEDVEEREGCHEKFVISFVLNRAIFRTNSTEKYKKTTFGLKNLVRTLSDLDPQGWIDSYSFRSSSYLGACFVMEDKLIGYEFVERKGTISRPGIDSDLLGK